MDMSARIEAALKEQQQRRSGDVIAVGRAVLRSRRVASTGGSGVVATASSIRGGVMTPADGKGEEVGASARSDFRKERYGERGERTRQAIGDGEAVHDEGQESSHDSDDSIIDTNAQQRRNTRGRRRQKKRQGRDVSVFGDAFVVSAAAANRKNSTRRKVARSSKKRGREQQRCIDTETFGEKHRTVVAEPEEGDEESAGNEKDEQIKEAKKGNHAGKIKEKEEKGGEEDDDKEEEDDGKEEEEDDDKEEGEIVTSDCIVSDGIDFSGGSDDSSGMSATELRPREDIDVIPAVAAVIDHGRLPWRPRRREDLTSGTRLEFERAGGRGAGSGRRSIRIARGVGERNSGNDGRAQRAAQRATRKSRSGSSGGSKVQDFRNQDEGILLGTSPRGGGEIRVVRGVNGGEGDGGSGEDSGGCEEGSVEEADIAVNDSGDGDDTNMIFGRESFRAGVENEEGGTESEGEVEGQDRTQQQRQKPNKCSSSTGSKRCFSEHRSTVLLGEEKETEVEDGPDRSLAENDFELETEAVVIGASTAVARGGSVRATENGDCETDTTMAKNAKKGKVHTRRTRRRLQRLNGDTKDHEESDEDTELFENDQS